MTKTTYCLGFALCAEGKYALMIAKKRPHWHAGKLHGIIGHIPSRGSTSLQAMNSTALDNYGFEARWEQVLRFHFVDAEFIVFTATVPLAKMKKIIPKVDEPQRIVNLQDLPDYKLAPVAAWTLPMARFHMFEAPFDRLGFLQIHADESLDRVTANESAADPATPRFAG